MNPLFDGFEAALYRRVFKWLTLFLSVIWGAGLISEIRYLVLHSEGSVVNAWIRGGLIVFNFLTTLWAFRSTLPDKAFLRIPPAVIAVNFATSMAILALGRGNAVIGMGTYLVLANLYIISFSFFARRQGVTLAFGGLFLAGAVVLFQFFVKNLFPLPYDETRAFRAYTYILIFGVVETTVLIAFNNRVAAIVIERVHAHGEEMRRIAYTDQVTGIPNGLQLSQDMKEWESRDPMKRTPRFLMIGFRLDGLETMNEVHGLEFTNRVLADLTNRYKTALEEEGKRFPLYDSQEGFSTLYRVEGNSFVFVTRFPDIPLTSRGQPILKTIIRTLNEEYRERIGLSFQGGYTVFPDDADTTEQLFRNLLNLIHGRRKEDMGVFVGFDEERYQVHLRRESLREGIAKGIAEGEFSVVYQPKVTASGESVEGFEALARWQSPYFGTVSPGEFIPLAEEAGEIGELTDFVIAESMNFLERLAAEGFGETTISVNLSPGTIHADYLGGLVTAVERSGLGKRLEFEITEGIIMKMTNEAAREFDRLKKAGVWFSIDDFGTGYSNLGYLQNFEAQVLKIDKRFIDGIPLDEKNTKLVVAILQMAHSFGMRTVAEGVEYAEQLHFLRDNGCDAIQGYYFAKPLNQEEALEFCGRKGFPA